MLAWRHGRPDTGGRLGRRQYNPAVTESTWRTLGAVRTFRAALAELLALRRLRLRGFDVVLPLAAILTVAGFRHQLWDPLASVSGLPFALIWAALAALALALVVLVRILRPQGRTRASGSDLRPAPALSTAALALGAFVVSGWLVYDLWMWQHSNQLYDLDVYLGSAGRWIAGGQPYMTEPVTRWPVNPAADFFLYPPPLLPFFGLLSELPNPAVAAGWTAFLVACAYGAFRALGLTRVWSLALLAFPPVANGFESGNIAILAFFLFALGRRKGALLPLDGLFKAQLGLPALWLVRSGRWRAILAALALIAALVLLTLPLVGLDSWRAWIAGLGYRSQSQAAVLSLYGFSYARVLPGPVFAAVAAATVGLAFVFSGRRGLAAFGLVTIIASPALWPHGFAFALPAVLMLENGGLVLAVLGAGVAGADIWLLFYAGCLAVIAAPRLPDARHPMAGTDGPWPRAMPSARRTTRSLNAGLKS